MKDIVYATPSQITSDEKATESKPRFDVLGLGTAFISAYTELENAKVCDIIANIKKLIPSTLLIAAFFGVYAFIKAQEGSQ